MSIMNLLAMMDAIDANARMVKEGDKDFLNDLNNRVCGTNTICITDEEQQRVANIHAEMFSAHKAKAE